MYKQIPRQTTRKRQLQAVLTTSERTMNEQFAFLEDPWVSKGTFQVGSGCCKRLSTTSITHFHRSSFINCMWLMSTSWLLNYLSGDDARRRISLSVSSKKKILHRVMMMQCRIASSHKSQKRSRNSNNIIESKWRKTGGRRVNNSSFGSASTNQHINRRDGSLWNFPRHSNIILPCDDVKAMWNMKRNFFSLTLFRLLFREVLREEKTFVYTAGGFFKYSVVLWVTVHTFRFQPRSTLENSRVWR